MLKKEGTTCVAQNIVGGLTRVRAGHVTLIIPLMVFRILVALMATHAKKKVRALE